MRTGHSIVREGLLAGFLGATAVEGWFFIVDVFGGRPLFTPNILGGGLLSVFGRSPEPRVVNIIGYTIFHYAAFTGVGMLAVLLVHQGERMPSVLAGAMILFVAIELGFYGLVALLQETVLGNFAWYQVLAGNLLAAALMGT